MIDKEKPFLRVHNISKTFPGVQALDDVSLSVYPGEIHGLIGENGAGKSTLVKILSGALDPTEGEVVLGDHSFSSLNPTQAQANGVSTVYQEQELIPGLNIAENIYLGEEPRKYNMLVNHEKMIRDANNLIRDYGLERDAGEVLADLPIAERQQVAIIKAAHRGSRILLLDEPTASLTASQIDSLFDLIRELSNQGMGVVYISHNLEEVLDIAGKITVLRDGQKVGTFEKKKVTKPDLVEHMAGHEVQTRGSNKKHEHGKILLEVEDALGSVSFTLREKEILGIAGTMGSGARKILRGISGIDPLAEGSLKFRGEEYIPENVQDSVSRGIFFIPEDMRGEGLVLPMPLAKNITLPKISETLSRGFIDLKKEKSFAEDHVESLGIATPDVDTAVRYLSGGNQRKVLFAKALHADADLLLLEDPTQGVDVNARQEIHELFEELRKQGKSLIVLSSDLDELLDVSDRIISLYHGELSGEFDPAEIDRQVLISSILGEKTEYV
ncbi:sugar ABC transporter ATP-binding protein [Candidatus Bipolaricaulota bacterium]|nr:sugar ABC transporter ATP-binding protein [Candidatus Bipolaricaulota bacterium]